MKARIVVVGFVATLGFVASYYYNLPEGEKYGVGSVDTCQISKPGTSRYLKGRIIIIKRTGHKWSAVELGREAANTELGLWYNVRSWDMTEAQSGVLFAYEDSFKIEFEGIVPIAIVHRITGVALCSVE